MIYPFVLYLHSRLIVLAEIQGDDPDELLHLAYAAMIIHPQASHFTIRDESGTHLMAEGQCYVK